MYSSIVHSINPYKVDKHTECRNMGYFLILVCLTCKWRQKAYLLVMQFRVCLLIVFILFLIVSAVSFGGYILVPECVDKLKV